MSDGYELAHADTASSGYSFGGNQMDLANNSNARAVLEDILINARDENNDLIFADGAAFYASIEADLFIEGDTNALTTSEQQQINSALESSYGVGEVLSD